MAYEIHLGYITRYIDVNLGLLNRTDLDEILGDRATCQIIEHKRYRAARGQAPAGSPTKVSELLYVVPL